MKKKITALLIGLSFVVAFLVANTRIVYQPEFNHYVVGSRLGSIDVCFDSTQINAIWIGDELYTLVSVDDYWEGPVVEDTIESMVVEEPCLKEMSLIDIGDTAPIVGMIYIPPYFMFESTLDSLTFCCNADIYGINHYRRCWFHDDQFLCHIEDCNTIRYHEGDSFHLNCQKHGGKQYWEFKYPERYEG